MFVNTNRLNAKGYPVNPKSIFICVQRKYLPTREELEKISSLHHPEVILPVRNYGCWEQLVGFIGWVRFFPDGIVIEFPQNLAKSLLKWPNAVLWIPNMGTAGILS